MAEFAHIPVMMAEVLEHLVPQAGKRYVDGTLGGAGHATAILRGSGPDGQLFGCDRDAVALEVARERLAEFGGRFELRHGNFDRLPEWLPENSVAGVLLDLGVSSPQLDQAERGFSFQQDGPLDMRMDQQQAVTAADLVNEAEPVELVRIFWEYGEERNSRRMARAIEQERMRCRIETTGHLAGLLERVVPRGGQKIHPATRAFQALRIAVNDELGSLRRGLAGALKVLQPAGRLLVISFHSGEDRVVKEFGREEARDYTFPGEVDVPELRQPRQPRLKLLVRKPLEASEEEISTNPRSRSAKLRIFGKI